MVEDKVRAPGIILMVVAGINLCLQLAQIAYYGLVMVFAMMAPSQSGTPMKGEEQLIIVLYFAAVIVIALVAIAWNGFIGYAGWKMQRLESYNLAMAGAILAIVPCFGCCLLNMPAGIFALVVLNDSLVKDSFRT